MITKERILMAAQYHKTDYYIGGELIKITPLNWPKYNKYTILNIDDYVKTQTSTQQNRFHLKHPDFFDKLVEEIGDPDYSKIIVPDFSSPKTSYDPLESAPNLFNQFIQVYYNQATDEAILKFVRAFGLPFKTTGYYRTDHFKDAGSDNDSDRLIKSAAYFEKILEQEFGNYVMLKQTIDTLSKEANSLIRGYDAITNSEIPPKTIYEIALDFELFETSESFWDFFHQTLNSLDTDHTAIDKALIQQAKDVLSQTFTKRMIGYLNKVSPSIDLIQQNGKKDYFVPSWRIPDLWSVMMVQLYEYILSNQPIRYCLQCKTPFVQTHKGRLYCPPPDNYNSSTRSPCQNNAAVKRNRNKKRTTVIPPSE